MMFSAIGKSSRAMLFRELLVALAIVGIVIFGLWLFGGATTHSSQGGTHFRAISGWLIAMVWVVLFITMGLARWRLRKSDKPGASAAGGWMLALIIFCALYPIYTNGFSNMAVGFCGNIATIFLSIFVIRKIPDAERRCKISPFLVIIWLFFASAIIADESHWIPSVKVWVR
jgi:tryptophan-rich sensory protein